MLWAQEQKQLHEEIFELQRTERMWLESNNTNDSRYENFVELRVIYNVKSNGLAQEGSRASKRKIGHFEKR